jgi:2-polyprenyl-3-methyl-5-hydroxy-6-metoxy-1,4-benzoquinol methylase
MNQQIIPSVDVEKTIGGLHSFLFPIVKGYSRYENPSIFDVGCGSGIWLRRLAGQGFNDLYGMDVEVPANTAGFSFYQINFNNQNLPQEFISRFSMVTCIEVIEHVENPGHLLDFIAEALLPQGILILTTPNIESIRARLRALLTGKIPNFDGKGDPTHIFPILEDSLVKLMRPRSLIIEKVIQYPSNKKVTLMYRPLISRLAYFLGLGLPNPLYGDICVYIIRKV